MTATPDQLKKMGKAIVDFEARRGSDGNLEVYDLPSGDGGGTYEVAGINDRYHPVEAEFLKDAVEEGRYEEAEAYILNFIIKYTDAVSGWSAYPGVEFYLRDCCFNRGPKGAALILQRAVRTTQDGKVGPITKKAASLMTAEGLLTRLRSAREAYEREVAHRNESSKFWKGLVNRWNKVLKIAQSF